jgi:hypothetical protein
LCAFVRCLNRVYAWPVAAIDHLAGTVDIEAVSAGLVRARGKLWSVFELATLMGDGEEESGSPAEDSAPTFHGAVSFIMAEIPIGFSSPLPVALRVDACLAVRQLRRLTELPDALASERATAFHGLFTASDVAGGLGSERLGYLIDPVGLLALEERQSAMAALKEAGAWNR